MHTKAHNKLKPKENNHFPRNIIRSILLTESKFFIFYLNFVKFPSQESNE